jgi:hypothetical protein
MTDVKEFPMTGIDGLDAALAPEKVSGPRYNERQQAMVDR